jgi:hypothetical protein
MRTIEDAKKRIEQALSLGSQAVNLGITRQPVGPIENSATPVSGNVGDALSWLIQHESGGRTSAKNPKSSAFGLGQLLKGNREKYGSMLGFDPNTTDYNQQLEMMKRYITDRYKTPEAAKDFWQRKGWY